MKNTAAALRIELTLENRVRGAGVDLPGLRARTIALLGQPALGLQLAAVDVCLIGDVTMARLNREHLGHEGTTDVVTFPYPRLPGDPVDTIRGELFVCVPEACRQARAYRRPVGEELLRYVVHGVLHLRGFDDLTPGPRRAMKRLENRLTSVLFRPPVLA